MEKYNILDSRTYATTDGILIRFFLEECFRKFSQKKNFFFCLVMFYNSFKSIHKKYEIINNGQQNKLKRQKSIKKSRNKIFNFFNFWNFGKKSGILSKYHLKVSQAIIRETFPAFSNMSSTYLAIFYLKILSIISLSIHAVIFIVVSLQQLLLESLQIL